MKNNNGENYEAIETVYRADFADSAERSKWERKFAYENLSPFFKEDEKGLTMAGNGGINTFGWYSRNVPVKGGKRYLLRTVFSVVGIDDINLHILNLLTWRIKGRPESSPAQDNVTYYRIEGGYIVGEQAFVCHGDTYSVDIQLLLRHCPDGSVTWKSAELICVEPQKKRPVRVSATKWQVRLCAGKEDHRKKAKILVEKAAAEKSDIIVLPEFASYYDYSAEAVSAAEKVPGGEFCQFLSDQAKKHEINIAAGILELAEDGTTYNTCVIFDRNGEYVGAYRKVHLYWPETMFNGTTPGDDFPVFDLDFGRVGVMICYDCWYGECARLLALKGAEVILFPAAGYEEKLLPARAIDNNVYIVCAQLNSSSYILDTKGECLAKIDQSSDFGVETAEIDLSVRQLPHVNAGGTMNSGSGGRRSARNSRSDKIYREITQEMGTWENRREYSTWVYM
ncbi:MAG: carbon-nitrogen hydrolase family protein [Oscillospiraceae bacterium]|nr:carbon-nitrogen hydrolase family protein [Oscillospiraceae bacterium]